MDESKKINAGKYRNKQRYKNKAKVVPKEQKEEDKEKETSKIIIDDSDVFHKRSLESNWYRYEPKQEDDEDSSRDYSVLALAPISQGSYFQFKSDKKLAEAEDIKQTDNKLFHLDVNLLSLSIATIPFHEQCGIDEKYFHEGELNAFVKDARDNSVKYETYLKCHKEKSSTEVNTLKETPKIKNNYENTSIVNETQPSNCSVELGRENLEQWLDDILDD